MAIDLLNDLNIVGNPTLLLQNRNCETIGVIANPSGLKYKDNFNSANELSFTTYKFIDNEINPLWDKLKDLKIVSIPDYKVRFQIEPTTSEENNLSKSIVGTELCQAELSQISLRNIYINTSEDILNNDYDENLPTVFCRDLNNYNAYDWLWKKHRYEYLRDTTLYSTEESVIKEKKRILARASMLHRLLEKAPNYTIGHIDDSLKNIQRQLTVDGSSIYDTLTQTVAETFGCVFIFDSWTRTINAYDLYNTCANDDCDYLKTYGVRYRADFNDCCPKCGSKNIKGKYGEIAPILINSRNIAKQIELKSNVDELKNCFYISGGDDLTSSTISNINPNGSRYIYYFSDDIKSDMPTELVDKLNSYEKLTEEMNQSHTFVISKELIDSYNAVVDYINEHFTETTVDEDGIETKKEKFKKQPYSLIGYPATTNFMYDAIDLYYFLHDSMYPVLEISEFSLQESLDSIVNGFNKGFETEDGTVFKNQIAVQNSDTLVRTTIENNIEDLAQLYYSKAYYDITVNTKTYEKATKDANGKWVGYITLTSKTQKDENDQYIHGDTSDITLEIIDSSAQLELFITQKIYRTMSNADDLKDKQLTSFNLSEEIFKKDIELYSLSELENILKEFEACRNIVTTSFDKGTIDSDNGDTLKNKYYTFYYNRISMLNDEIAVRQNQIDDVCKIYSIQDGVITGELAELRSTVNAALNLEKYLGTDLWKLLHCYIREDDYRNENYKSDGLETNSELIKRCQQLYDVACENLYKAGTLQYQLTTSINNLLILPEFKPVIKNFKIGNFLNVEIDNKVYFLRLLSYEINYDSLNDLSVEFSTVEKIYRGYSDVKSVLQKASSMATSFSSISSQVEESSKTSDVINDWTKNGITGDQEIKDSTDKNLVIDKNGILARSKNENSNDYDPHQLKILHSGLYTTSDNWKTTDAGIGKFTYKDINGNTIEDYGIIAKTVVGNLIIGKNLQIFSEDKSVIIDSSGLTIDGGVLKIIGKDISGEGVTISEVIIDLDTAKKLAELAKSTADTANNTANTAKDTADKAETKAQQSLDQFLWLVKSGSSSTSLTLTDSAITAITKQFTITSPDGTSTIIEGGKLKTDALKSNNYVAGNDGTYSSFGTFIDLEDGSIHTPGFYLDMVGNAFYKGTVNATAGYFGNDENNWYIGTAEFNNIRNNNDVLVNNVNYSALISKGNAALTAGDWYLMSQESGLGVQSGWTTINGGNYVFDKQTQKYYDMGMVEPIFGSKNEWDDKFLYIRRVKDPSSSQATWEYLFKVDKDGTIFENGTKLSDKYARKDAVGSTYLPLTGGTVTGNLTVNGTLTATASKANQLNHTLSVNGKSWNGSADLTVGTMGVTYGGTGKSSWTANGIIYASASSTLSQLSLGTAGYILQSGGTSAPSWVNPSTLNVASATKATQDGNGNTISDTYLRKDFDSISQNVSFDGSVDIGDLTAGTLLVSGAARFANGLIGNLKGTASNVPWSGITDKPKTFAPSAHTHTMANISDWDTYVYSAQGTRTKNTVLAAPNGSNGKATFRTLVEADIPTLSKSKVGLSNVDNTADSTKNVLSASKLTTARNINGVAFDGLHNITITANPTATRLTDENLDDITTPGEYFAVGSNAVTNKPSGVDAFSLQVFRSAEGWYEQVIIGSNLLSGKIYQRRRMGTAWSSWTSVYSELFKPSKSDVGLGNVDNTADSLKNVSSATKLTTARNITVGSAKKSFDGTADISFSLADIGASSSGHTHNYASKLILAGTDYSCVSNTITITKANLQTAIGSTGLGLMTAEERSKLDSIKVSSGGTIDFSGVTASGALAAVVGDDKTVAITHNTSGVKAGTYKSVTVDTYGHVTAGTNPTTLSGYGITDALSSSTKYALSDRIGGNALKANLLASLGRLTDANVTVTGSGGVATFKASSSMTANKPPKEGHILHFYWDNKNNWDSQMCISADSSPTVYVRGMTGQANTYGDWKTLLDSTNYSNYTVKKDGTGASGTWGIDITGSATSATNDSNGKKISDTYLPLTGGTISGLLNIKPNTDSWAEGIRIHPYNNWASIVLCGTDNTGDSGTSTKTWSIHNKDGLFYIAKNGSSAGDAQLSCIDDNIWRVNGNELLHTDNYNSYAPTLTGTGASGTWDISITGNAKTATSADSATKATQDENGNVISSTYLPLSGGVITGDLKVNGYLLGETKSTGATNHAILLGHANQNYMNFYETGGLFQFYKSTGGKNTLLGKITSKGWEGNVVGNVTGNLSGNATSATKATKDGAGNVITSKYVTIDTTQTISGAKTFSKETTISSATASTSKTTGALKVKGGIASEGQISADKVMIGDKCTLEYDANLQCLNFVFA